MLTNQTTSFIERISKGETFSRQIFDDLLSWGFNVALNGTEHTHPDFVKLLHSSIDQTSLMIRYQPDGVASCGRIPRSFYVEAKASKFIERDAYLNYIRLQTLGAVVYIVFQYNDTIGFCEIQDLSFEPITSNSYPVEDGWLCPRMRTDWMTYRQTFKGSGTPFRSINIDCLMPWDQFKRTAIARLIEVTHAPLP